MSASPTAPHVLDREIDALRPLTAHLRPLEQRLESFTQSIQAELDAGSIDESDEDASTKHYVERLAQANLLELVVPHDRGGWAGASEVPSGVSAVGICLARQWLSRVSGALDNAFVMQGLGSFPLVLGEADERATALYPSIRSGETICAFAITEPEAGSDVANMQTTATAREGGVSLSGMKCFISNAGLATSYVVFAREPQREQPPQEGQRHRPAISAFWVPGDAEGLTVERTRVIAPHPIGKVHLEDVVVPEAHRLGEPGQGLRIALQNLDQFRPTVGAAALGMADRALEVGVSHLSGRIAFGKPLSKQQGLRFAWAQAATDHMAAQLLVYRASAARDRGAESSEMVAMAKLSATETAQRVIDLSVQSLGGLGVTVGQDPERLYREIRALRIYEGTSEIQKLVIARSLF